MHEIDKPPFGRYETPLDADRETRRIDAALDRLDTRLADMGARLDRIEASVDHLRGSLHRLQRLHRLFMLLFSDPPWNSASACGSCGARTHEPVRQEEIMRPRRQSSGNFPNYSMTTHEQCWKVARGSEEYWSGIHYTYDCSCQCYFFHPLLGDLQTDWGVCTNPQSPRAGLLTFEHMGCAFYASPYHAGRNPTYHVPRDSLPGKKRPKKEGSHEEYP